MTRRTFLPCAAAAAVQLRAQPRAKVEPIVTISKRPDRYHGWASLALRKNGDLMLVYSGGRESHVCPFGRVELMRSPDGGSSWSWPEVLMDSAIDDRDAGIYETPSGSVLVTTFTSLAYEAALANAKDWPREKMERWQAANLRLKPAERKSLVGTWMLRSPDGGLTWSAPFRVPLNSPHGPVSLADGRLIYPGKQLWEPGAKVGVADSADDGRTWRWLSEIPARPGDTVAQYHELHGIQAANGTIIVHIRNHNQVNSGETLQCESQDGGRTWTIPHPIGVWGLPSHLLRLNDGRLLMSYGYRRQPFGNQARISADHGRTWSEPMTISADGASGDLGYPTTVQLADGQLITAWYELPKESPHAVIRMARWRL
jgi:hypothetical protein